MHGMMIFSGIKGGATMEEFVSDMEEDNDIYTVDGFLDFIEEDHFTPEEEGFMLGYICS